MEPIVIDYVLPSDILNGKLEKILNDSPEITCSKPLLTISEYTREHMTFVARRGSKHVGIIVFRVVPGYTPIVYTLCSTDYDVQSELMKILPSKSYPKGRSPAVYPPGYTSYYDYDLEGKPHKLALPTPAIDDEEKTYTADFKTKTEGPSAFFSNIRVKSGKRRSKTRKRKHSKQRKTRRR